MNIITQLALAKLVFAKRNEVVFFLNGGFALCSAYLRISALWEILFIPLFFILHQENACGESLLDL